MNSIYPGTQQVEKMTVAGKPSEEADFQSWSFVVTVKAQGPVATLLAKKPWMETAS